MARTLLFVHGTGVRAPALAVTMTVLQRKVAEHLPGWRVQSCNWGDAFGARMNLKGVSVPVYAASGNAVPALEAAAQARWVLLASDPLIELRVSPGKPLLGPLPGPDLWKAVQGLKAPAGALTVLKEYDLADEWPKFHGELVQDKAWAGTVSALSLKGPEVNDQIARALVAAFQRHLREESIPGLTHVGRDALAKALQADLGGGLGLGDWLLKQVTNFMEPRRGKLTDGTSPIVGDILRYQARGDTLRKFIGEELKRTGAEVLMGHSLGGIAAVDFLAEAPSDVIALITVGSQAPYFYEIDALASRPFGQGLPDHFPKRWLNAYDERDFLSYRGSEVFPGKVTDVRVASGQAFPDSHGAYWHNDKDFWQPVADFLR